MKIPSWSRVIEVMIMAFILCLFIIAIGTMMTLWWHWLVGINW